MKTNVQHVSFNIFWQALIWTYNDNLITFHTVDPIIIYSILFFFMKESRASFSTRF